MRPSLRFAFAAVVAAGCSPSSPGDLFGADAGPGTDATAPSPLTVTPGTIDFGAEDCGGAAPAPHTVTVTNVGTASLSFTADIDERAAFAVDGARSGTLDPGASQTLTVVAEPASSSTAAGAIAHGALDVRVGGVSVARASLSSVARGGAMVAPSQVGFGTVTVGDAAELSLSISNAGNAPVTVSLGTPTDAYFTALWDAYPAPVVLEPGGVLAGARVRFAPAGERNASATLPILVAGVVCGGATSPVLLVAHAVLPVADAGTDAAADAGEDAGGDAASDAGADSGLDGGADAALDAAPDAAKDAASADAGSSDATID